MDLEEIIGTTRKTLAWYGSAIKDNYKQFIPSLLVASAFAWGGQELADFVIQNPSEGILQLSGYITGTIGGYSTFLTLEYKNKRQNYPNGFLSRDMGKTLVDLISSDYLSDLISFTPVFVAVNHYLLNKGINAGASGGISAGVGSITYFFTICALYDRFQALTHHVNNGIKKLGTALASIFNINKPNIS